MSRKWVGLIVVISNDLLPQLQTPQPKPRIDPSLPIGITSRNNNKYINLKLSESGRPNLTR
jgi:hypothetical protein